MHVGHVRDAPLRRERAGVLRRPAALPIHIATKTPTMARPSQSALSFKAPIISQSTAAAQAAALAPIKNPRRPTAGRMSSAEQ